VNAWLALAAGIVGLVCTGIGLVALRRSSVEGRAGALVAIDAGRPITLRSTRYHLVGRPDAVRRRPDGSLVPVELKHRPTPAFGPFPSHLVQLGAYCLLIEEGTDRPPPFGVLRYTDGELSVPWDGPLRARVLTALAGVMGPYDGRADPSAEKCRRCVWSPRCDASLGRQGHADRRERRAR